MERGGGDERCVLNLLVIFKVSLIFVNKQRNHVQSRCKSQGGTVYKLGEDGQGQELNGTVIYLGQPGGGHGGLSRPAVIQSTRQVCKGGSVGDLLRGQNQQEIQPRLPVKRPCSELHCLFGLKRPVAEGKASQPRNRSDRRGLLSGLSSE